MIRCEIDEFDEALVGRLEVGVGHGHNIVIGDSGKITAATEDLHRMGNQRLTVGRVESVAFGISGAGDLITTCISPDSRNRRMGVLLAQGRTLQQALSEVRMTVEGVAMSQTIETLWALDVSIPLFHMVNAILRGERCDPRKEIASLIASISSRT